MPVAALPLHPTATYVGKGFPKFGQPREIAHFSRDASRRVRFDKSGLGAYRTPRLPAALDVGFESYVPKSHDPNEPAPLGDVVAALSHKGVRTTDAHILTYRNNLNKIFGTVYNRKDDWEVGVERCADGTVLLHVMDTERKRAEEARRDERQQRMSYWGYKLSTLDGGEDDGGPLPPVNANEEFCSSVHQMRNMRNADQPVTPVLHADGGIVQLSIDRTKLFMAAEIDCAATGGGGAPAAGYVELKTSKRHASPRDEETVVAAVAVVVAAAAAVGVGAVAAASDEEQWVDMHTPSTCRPPAVALAVHRRASSGTSSSSTGCSLSSRACRLCSSASATSEGRCTSSRASRPRRCTGSCAARGESPTGSPPPASTLGRACSSGCSPRSPPTPPPRTTPH
ncbi:hypothetical protein EMIHUDRAFT_458336 [Emiliania huxleyi CCMP1516]|uniref:Decapping nuclease n=2 Tax=Emiliania huxleyi TaxID=2903 RepID=A0A0D3JDE1_EMIH1|nr:hypothetical protein EMIHUDRAFT_458336 [Emiliania huxleyi CCMP1516]EOD21526.1 hypothetical protein EMIHUDRAFT_458336 [Emiliania huxleyi CCMP1516]|eukprot:XP_005773955.1 hypothetical protein EMIHUDRAFT_458336 [Emiliania huxleyi CCMP1516]